MRRYPFVFSTPDNGKTFMLCVDEAFPGFNRDGRGQKLFNDGKPTPYVDNVLKFLQEYRTQFMRTKAFTKKLAEHKLLEPMQAQFRLGEDKMSLGGFMAIDRQKLKALPGEVLAQLAATDELELMYLHLQSMRNFSEVKDRLVSQQADGAGIAPIVTADPVPATGAAQDKSAARGGKRGPRAEAGASAS